MKKTLISAVVFLLAGFFVPNGGQKLMAADNSGLNIIPKPVKIKPLDGSFELNQDTSIYIKDGSVEMGELATYLAEIISKETGNTPEVKSKGRKP